MSESVETHALTRNTAHLDPSAADQEPALTPSIPVVDRGPRVRVRS